MNQLKCLPTLVRAVLAVAMEGPVVLSTAAAPIYRFTSESIMQERQMSGVREPSDGRTDVSYDILQLLF